MKRKIVSRKKPTTRGLKARIAKLVASCDRVLKTLRRTFKAALA